MWNKTRVLGTDSFHLLAAMWRKQNGQSARDVLVNSARINNGVATSLLAVDKEVGLYRYYGMLGYLREKRIGASNPITKRLLYAGSTSISTTGGDSDPDGPEKKDNKNQVAKVAFMITSSQRTELSERLGYEPEDIKKLKPVEASLILQNNVCPDDVDAKLGGLVQEHNDELVRQHREAKHEAKQEAEQLQAKQLTNENEAAEVEVPTDEKQADPLLLEEVKLAALEKAEDFEEGTSMGSAKMWYEVVETRVSDGSAIPVALYQDEEEAKMCLELKEGFADRRAKEKKEDPSTTYTIRKTMK